MPFRWTLAALSSAGSLRQSRPGVHPRRTGFGVEALEDRTVPSAFTVLNLADSGTGSLRAAVQAAEANPGADVIDFAHGVTGTIVLTTGQIAITSDLTIDGPGANKLTVSGNDACRIFNVIGGSGESSRIAVSISGLTLSHGTALGFGGAVGNLFFSTLTLSHVTLSDNHSLGQPGARTTGGAVANLLTGADLSVCDSLVVHNTADGNGGQGSGGGIFSSGDAVSVTDSVVTGNRSVGGPGFAAFGGGIEVTAGTLAIAGSTIMNNEALADPAAGRGASGGGLFSQSTTLTITGSTLADNLALGGPGGSGADGGNGYGGGIYNDTTSSLALKTTSVTGNHANGGDGGDGEGIGGGVHNLGDFDFDALTLIVKNHASTSHDDLLA